MNFRGARTEKLKEEFMRSMERVGLATSETSKRRYQKKQTFCELVGKFFTQCNEMLPFPKFLGRF